MLHGEMRGVVDDIVVRRNDGVAAYHLAVVVDDADSGVDQVVRGDDLLPSAISQAYLAGLLGQRHRRTPHVPLAANAEGRRLAKRDGAVTLADLAALGSARRCWGALHILGLPGVDHPRELLDHFDPVALPKDPWVVGLSSCR